MNKWLIVAPIVAAAVATTAVAWFVGEFIRCLDQAISEIGMTRDS